MKKTIGLIISILGIALLGVGGTMMILSSGDSGKSNKELFTDAMEKGFGLFTDGNKQESEIETTIEEFTKKLESNIYKLTVNGSFTEGKTGYTKLSGTMYLGNNQFYVTSLLDSNNKIYQGEALLKDDRVYVYVKDIFSKFYYIDGISDMLANTGSTKLIEKVVNYLIDSVKDAIQEEDVTIEDDELVINTKVYDTKKYQYTFSGNTLYNVLAKFADKIKNDKEIVNEINALLQSSNIDIELGDFELNQQNFNLLIDELLEYAKEFKSIGKLATISLYMYDDEVISRKLTILIPTDEGSLPYELADYKVVENGKLYYKVALKVSIQELGSLEIKQLSDSESSITIKYMGQEIAKGKYTKSSEGINITLTGTNEDLDLNLDLTINNDNTGSLELEVNDTSFTLDYKLEEVDSIPEVDVSNAAPYAEIPEEEKEAFEKIFNMFNVISAKDSVSVNHELEVKKPANDDLNFNMDCKLDEDGTLNCSGLDM